MVKPIVNYIKEGAIIIVGQNAIVVTLNHPSVGLVTPGHIALTSKVVAYCEESGDFETENTRYVTNG
jgi:hypothetical protein